MAYMCQTKKKQLAPGVKAVLKKYGMKGTLSVRNHTALVCKIKSGALDVISNYVENLDADYLSLNRISREDVDVTYIAVNKYHLENAYTGEVLSFLQELKAAMMKGNHDNSDPMTDYFDVGWYIDIRIGDYDKPYELTA